MDPVLVIGGCGCQFVSDVTVFDINTSSNHIDSAKYIEGSLSSYQDIRSALQQVKPRVIFNTASPKMFGQRNLRERYAENIHGTRFFLDCIKEIEAVKALIYTSSSSVVHDNTTDLLNATENLPLCFEPQQKEYYTHTKAAAEQLVLTSNGSHGLLTAAVRAAMLFGERDLTTTPNIVENALRGRGKFQIGDGTNLVDFTYVGSTAYAHILAAKALLRESAATEPIPEDIRVNGEAFVITNDEPWPFWEFTRAMGAAAGFPVRKEDVWVVSVSLYYWVVVFLEWVIWGLSFGRREAGVKRGMVKYLTMTRTFGVGKAKRRLGYRPRVGMEEGIRRAVESYLEREGDGKKTM
ncbi:putative 3-beta hydroxysteroid dehydrogenase/isomerase family protein [Mollisia scopiformis]|uniref:Putative 3-beta hydroxysteroid dehydrogenase/isomerase family protein n=1 Tax=Mollisia scopiformis TaxID=149040 RepID=A0A194X838_MOLSC|nr:putative 3-beta hydroxysteroid dehydrogenase/isomerase family protein [Mollisia scopiformis]KUJ16330.1 putative 3-beta hydroxysteroid dehydrogenase/isomerase family protein [Mollisia scopiformis]